MAGQSTAVEHVRETLRALAVDPTGRNSGGDTGNKKATVAERDLVGEAERALASVEGAATFADDDGFRRTATVAEAAADPSLARRARAVSESIERYRAAYRDAASDGSAVPADSPGPVDPDEPVDLADTANHFHSGRDRHIPAAEQPNDN